MKKYILILFIFISHIGFSQNITGGEEIDIKDAPYQISFELNGVHSCGGSILNNRFILTAAHCLTEVDLTDITIKAGVTERSNPVSTSQVFTVRNAISHSGFDQSNLINALNFDSDLALIEIDGEFNFNEYVQPIELISGTNSSLENIGNIVKVSGWGWTTPGIYSPADHLQAVNVPIISNATAASQLALNETTPPPVTANMIATDAVSSNTLGSCHGDSGGPLVYKDNDHLVQIGVVSWGPSKCLGGENAPSIYTRLSNFTSWIASQNIDVGIPRLDGVDYLCENTQKTFSLFNINVGTDIQWTTSDNLTIINQTDYFITVEQKNLSAHNGWVRAVGTNVNLTKTFEVGVPHAIDLTIFKTGSQTLTPNTWNWIQGVHNGSYDYNVPNWEWQFYASSGVTIASINGYKSTIHISPSTSGTVDVRARVANQCGYSGWKNKIFQIGTGGGGTGGPPMNN